MHVSNYYCNTGIKQSSQQHDFFCIYIVYSYYNIYAYILRNVGIWIVKSLHCLSLILVIAILSTDIVFNMHKNNDLH